jgi:hypothetical protein
MKSQIVHKKLVFTLIVVKVLVISIIFAKETITSSASDSSQK